MLSNRWLRRLVPILVCLVLSVTACTTSAPSPYDQVQKDTTGIGKPAAVSKEAEKGSTFNQFFPRKEGSFDVIPSQEKKGFAEYKLNQNGKTLAMLTINDTVSLPAAAIKYKTATEEIAGYPTVNQGITATGLLVSDRYQVKVLSRDESFSQEDRVEWLQKFDLQGLSELEAVASPQTSKRTAAESTNTVFKQAPKQKAPPLLNPMLQPAT